MFPCASADKGFATVAGGNLWSHARETATSMRQAGCFLGRSVAGTGVVSSPRPDSGMAGAVDDDFDLTEASVQRLYGGRIGNRVLVANVLRYLQGDLVHFGNSARIKRQPAGFARDGVQGPLGLLRLAFLFLIEQTDRINQHLGIARFVDQFFECAGARS